MKDMLSEWNLSTTREAKAMTNLKKGILFVATLPTPGPKKSGLRKSGIERF